MDPCRQLGDPGGHHPLDLVLSDPEPMRMTGREALMCTTVSANIAV